MKRNTATTLCRLLTLSNTTIRGILPASRNCSGVRRCISSIVSLCIRSRFNDAPDADRDARHCHDADALGAPDADDALPLRSLLVSV